MSLLETQGLAVGYWPRGRRASPSKERALLSNLDLRLEAGRFVALLGPNGSGKSTLLRSLVGMQWPLSGSITLGGAPLATMDVSRRAELVAAVLTERFDPGWFSVFDIVAFGRYPYTDLRNELDDRGREIVARCLDEVGLAAFAQRLFAELSDGERQKAMIARALAQETPLVILDEPTAFLDAPARIEIFHLARRLARQGKAVLLSTHEVDLALRGADELWLIDRKRGLIVGGPEDLALSGAIGQAFDGPGLSFDAATGIFRSPEQGLPFALGVSGEDPIGLAWTIRLVERLGLALEPERGLYDALVRVTDSASGLRWVLEDCGETISFDSLADLEKALRRLVSLKQGRD